MPHYEHFCRNEDCKHEWEDYYSITADPPKVCPKCNQETAQRAISGGSGKGIVELTGHEYAAKIKADAQKLKQEAIRNPEVMANLVGESKFNQIQTHKDRNRRR